MGEFLRRGGDAFSPEMEYNEPKGLNRREKGGVCLLKRIICWLLCLAAYHEQLSPFTHRFLPPRIQPGAEVPGLLHGRAGQAGLAGSGCFQAQRVRPAGFRYLRGGRNRQCQGKESISENGTGGGEKGERSLWEKEFSEISDGSSLPRSRYRLQSEGFDAHDGGPGFCPLY